MTEMNIVLKCNKCLKFKTPYNDDGVENMREHLKVCDKIPLKPAQTTIDRLLIEKKR